MKYFFLNAYLNTIEKHLADEIDFNRMINSQNENQAYNVLQDTNYGKWALQDDPLEKVFAEEKNAFCRDLCRMGFVSLARLFSLKQAITDLRLILKKEIFGIKEAEPTYQAKSEKNIRLDFQREIEKARTKKTPAELDDYLQQVYLDRLEQYAAEDKAARAFIKAYRCLEKDSDREKKHFSLKQLEEDFITEYSRQNEGFSPIFAFFMKKWQIEKKIKTIISAKQFNFSTQKIKDLTQHLQAL